MTPSGIMTSALPLAHVLATREEIKTPLLVVQGANDPRVNKREADQIVSACKIVK